NLVRCGDDLPHDLGRVVGECEQCAHLLPGWFRSEHPRYLATSNRRSGFGAVPARESRAMPADERFSLASAAFEPSSAIPVEYTCDGSDVSPPLEWSSPPDGTRAFALVVDDPDAPGGTFTHWLAWGLPPEAGRLGKGEVPPSQGRNGFGAVGYRGPCPPSGHGP